MSMTTLLMRLAGPYQSWGSRGVSDLRDTELEPTKSGVIGLLCAALGRPRTASLDDLVRLRMGVRVDRPGLVEQDFHTVGTAANDEMPTVEGGSKNTGHVTRRLYLADAEFLVGLEGEDRSFLEELGAALQRPKYPLFLGRKSCIPSRRIFDSVVDLPLEAALERAPWIMPCSMKGKQPPDRLRLVLDASPGTSAEFRRDVPLSFEIGRRAFAIRTVQTTFVQLTSDMIRQ